MTPGPPASEAGKEPRRKTKQNKTQHTTLMPLTKENKHLVCVCGWMLLQRQVLCSASSSEHSKPLLSHGGCSKEGSMTSRGSLFDP